MPARGPGGASSDNVVVPGARDGHVVSPRVSAGLSRWLHRASTAVGLVLVLVAIVVLGRELRQLPPGALSEGLSQIPRSALLLATVFTFFNYLILTGYDQLAFRYIQRAISPWQVAVASFVGYAIANNVGFALVSGTSARYRFYSRWGLSGQEISRVVVFYSGTYWLGLIVLGGIALGAGAVTGLPDSLPAALTRGAGWVLLACAFAYPVAAVLRRTPVRVAGIELPLPRLPFVGAQFVLSILDWTLAAAVLYVLLPTPRPEFPFFMGAFLAAQLVALVSHVPGGLGVFESLMILMLQLPAAAALPALALFRVVYYLVPLAAALAVLLADEFYHRRHAMVQWGNAFGTLTAAIAPKLIAVFMLLGAGVLLWSGATPAVPLRLAWLNTIVPLPVIELAHLVGSLTGAMLLVVAWALARRLQSVYALGAACLVVGITASLLKGGDIEAAAVLGALLVALALGRDEFDRKTPVSEIPASPSWMLAAVVVVGTSIAIGLFAYRHVHYSADLWLQFGISQDAPRFMRATAAVFLFGLVLGVRALVRPAPLAFVPPSPADLDRAASVLAAHARPSANLALTGDKALLWNAGRTAFLMYGIHGHTWVALGDPVGPDHEAEPLVRRFLERCDDFQGTPIFFAASRQWLHVYADYGLTFSRLGQEARVFLPHFALEGSGHKRLRTTLHRLTRRGASIRMVWGDEVSALLPALGDVSRDWLADRGSVEAGFAVGFHNPGYLERLPVALVEADGRVEAFAAILPGSDREEVALDLQRHRPAGPRGCADALLAWLLVWARHEGYRWFNLGLVPPGAADGSPVSHFWSRATPLIYGGTRARAGSIRDEKERFNPVWEPRYLVYPGGLTISQVVNDLTGLILDSPSASTATGAGARARREPELDFSSPPDDLVSAGPPSRGEG
jgi:phosphatidylglycerol lysyltransferase